MTYANDETTTNDETGPAIVRMSVADAMRDAGCWVDGHWGQYGVARVIDIAIGLGWDDERAADLATRHLAAMMPSDAPSLDDDEMGELFEAADDAEAWLNARVVPSGYAFGWTDGEWFLDGPDTMGDEWSDGTRAAVESDDDETGHDPECVACEHDCPWLRTSPAPMGAPFCAVCDDHSEARSADLDKWHALESGDDD